MPTIISEWIICPVCGSKTRDRIREDTELKHYPLYCPKCKQETLINAKELLREEVTENGTRYFISFKNGQGISHKLNVSYDFYMAFRRLELDNRKLENWDWRHREQKRHSHE